MKPAINDVMLAISSCLAASIIVKVTVILALGLIRAWLARRSRAAIRHALLAAAFGVLFVLPIVSILAPPLRIAVPALTQEQTVSSVTWFTEPIPGGPTVTSPGITPVPSRWSGLSLCALLTGFWIAGMTLFLLPVFGGLWQVRGLRRSGLPWRRGQSVAEMVAVELGIHRRVELLLHEALPGPMIYGAANPAIVLPRDAENWEGEDLNRSIVHELEHIRRGYWVTRCLARTACAVNWLHLLVWIAWRKLVLEAERSCDDAVLRHPEAIAYADQLVELAKRLSTARKSLIMAMAIRADLATRISALLDSRQRRGRAGTLSVAAACAVALVLVLMMSPLTLVAAPQAQRTQTNPPEVAAPQTLAQVSPVPAQAPPAPVAAAPRVPADPTSAPVPRKLKFEVASVKPVNPGVACGPPQIDSARFAYTTTLHDLIGQAYRAFFPCPTKADSGDCAFPGAPPWIYKDRFAIEAKLPEGFPAYSRSQFMGGQTPQLNQMLQALLEDRFKLKVHWEARTIPIFALTVAKTGPKVKPLADPEPGRVSSGPGGGVTKRLPNGTTLSTLNVVDSSMQGFADSLGQFMDRPVVDRTGLKGNFGFKVEWESEPDAPSNSGPGMIGRMMHAGPAMFTAIEELLGLKLESTKGPVEVLVIDHVEQPSPN